MNPKKICFQKYKGERCCLFKLQKSILDDMIFAGIDKLISSNNKLISRNKSVILFCNKLFGQTI